MEGIGVSLGRIATMQVLPEMVCVCGLKPAGSQIWRENGTAMSEVPGVKQAALGTPHAKLRRGMGSHCGENQLGLEHYVGLMLALV